MVIRTLSLLPSRSRSSITLGLEVYQSPFILYNPSLENDSDDDDRPEPSRFGLAITVKSDERKRIGGINVVRSVMYKSRILQSKHWTEWEEVQKVSTEVVGDCWVQGSQR